VSVEILKFVSADWKTHGGQQWEIGKTVSIPENRRGTRLCSGEVLHAYKSVEQALLMDPAYGSFGDSGRLLRATAPEIVADDGTKIGLHEITLTEELDRPAWWLDINVRRKVQVQFAVLCARAVLHLYESKYPGDDRPRKAIEAAETYLKTQSNDAAYAARAADAAADAAYAAADAARAAYAAADAARAATYAAAYAAYAAADAARAAYAAAYAAYAAADAARAAYAAIDVDTNALAVEAVKTYMAD
jgi:hypothetical protein